MRIAFPEPRQRQLGGIGRSKRSLKTKADMIAIAGTCPQGNSIGNTISAQQDPAHQSPCVVPKRIAPKSAAPPNAASSV
jgi:hypothetical protein